MSVGAFDEVRVHPRRTSTAWIEHGHAPAGRRVGGVPGRILKLQRQVGNRAVTNLMRQPSGAPLPLTDRPWSQIETERDRRGWRGILPGTENDPADDGLGLPGDRLPRLPIRLPAPDSAQADHGTPGAASPPLLLLDKSWRQHEHEGRVRAARERKQQAHNARREEIADQLARPRTPANQVTPETHQAQAIRNLEVRRIATVARTDVDLMRTRLTDCITPVPDLEAQLAQIGPNLVATPVATSYLSTEQADELAALQAAVTAAETGLRTRRLAATAAAPGIGALPGSLATALASPTSVDPAALQAGIDGALRTAGAALAIPVGDPAAQLAAADAFRRSHLSQAAITRKIAALVDAATTYPTCLLAGSTGGQVKKENAGKDKAIVVAAIAAAVEAQHNPKLGKWLQLLQTTNAKDGQLRIKNLTGGVEIAGKRRNLHLSVYLDSVTLPPQGINDNNATVLDALLLPGRHTGAHVTAELHQAIAPKVNPHLFRGEQTAVLNGLETEEPNKQRQDAVVDQMKARLDQQVDEITARLDLFRKRKGLLPGD